MEESRPRIVLPLGPVDHVLEWGGWVTLLIFWVLLFDAYEALPQTIPVHYGVDGLPDSFGDKQTILLIPAIASLLFIGITLLNRHPEIFNYPVQITPENAPTHYLRATRMLRFLKWAVLLIFGMIAWSTIQTANNQTKGIGAWFLPMVLCLVLIPVFVFLWQSFRGNGK